MTGLLIPDDHTRLRWIAQGRSCKYHWRELFALPQQEEELREKLSLR